MSGRTIKPKRQPSAPTTTSSQGEPRTPGKPSAPRIGSAGAGSARARNRFLNEQVTPKIKPRSQLPGSASRRTKLTEAKPTDTDEGQDIKFIDVPNSKQEESSKGGHMSTASLNRPVRDIQPEQILQHSQETDPAKVYEADLHASSIATIKNLQSFTKLRVLDLSCNFISKIQNLDKNTDLRELKLYDNHITDIENLESLKELCHIQLQHNKIKTVGKGLMALRKLKVLRLDSNHLATLDTREFTSCPHLTTVDLSNNKLESLTALSCLPNLEELYAVKNKLKTVGDLFRCKKLQEVDLSHNKLTELSGLKGLPNLTVINAAHNQLSTLKSLGKLRSLLELNVSGNRLADLDWIVQSYPAMEILDISQNALERWEAVTSLKRLTELVELYVSGNPFCEETGEKPQYHTDLVQLLASLQILDGACVKKMAAPSAAPVMRPMSAASVVSARQVESQLQTFHIQLSGFQTDLAAKFNSLRASFQTLPSESPSRPLSRRGQSAQGVPSSESRPVSRRMSRIRDAQQFANEHNY